MLIDNNMLKLAKMQETLLKVSSKDRKDNLEKYKTTVMDIDRRAFESLLENIEQINEHNHNLEEEEQFLEEIRDYYNQLYELQLTFIRVCENYNDNGLFLSNLSKIDIEYIENRINYINGYLINLKNIEINKTKLIDLNETLVKEEKNKNHLIKRISEYENELRESFLNAEGRIIENGNLKYISIISEFEKMDYDFKKLLEDRRYLTSLLNSVLVEKNDVEEKLQTAEICYNNVPNADSKQILDDIRNDCLNIRYRLTMLKVAQLLANDCDDLESFKDKREKIVDLIKYRVYCLEKMNIIVSFDPFTRTKLSEQLDLSLAMKDNTKLINNIKKELAELSERVDEMINENTNYLVLLSEKKELIVDNKGINNIDISSITLDIEDYIKVERAPLDNQVVEIRDLDEKLNMNIVKQKTDSVIKRVNEMMMPKKIANHEKELISPELVIVPKVNNDENLVELEPMELFSDVDNSVSVFEETEEFVDNEEVIVDKYSLDIFETVDPFVEAPLFSDRVDDTLEKEINSESLPILESDIVSEEESDLVLEYSDEEMPDAFWITQEENNDGDNNVSSTSFDEQINALLSAV